MHKGYNLRTHSFFMNFGNIFILGVLVTIVCFVILSLGLVWVSNSMNLTMIRYKTDLNPDLDVPETHAISQLPTMTLLMFSALLTCCDMYPCLGIGGLENRTNLLVTISGEAVLNPVMCIVLFGIIESLHGEEFTWAKTPLHIFGLLCLQIVTILIGAVYGFACCLMFKYMRFLTVSAVTETFMMTGFGLLAYFTCYGTYIAENMLNPPLALFIFAIIQGHFTWYNLSSQSKATTGITFEFLGEACKAATFCYIGLSVYPSIPGFVGWSYIFYIIPIIVIGRLLSVLVTFYLLAICFRKTRLEFREVLYLVWAGMIRGSISFALAINIPYNCPSG